MFAADFRPLDRNQRAVILYLAEALDRRTHQPGKHGGVIGRTGLAVLRALVTRFHNVRTGQLDPSLEAIAKAANMARSTVQGAIKRLELAGLLDHVRRIARVRVRSLCPLTGRPVLRDRVMQQTNAYRLNVPPPDRREHGDFSRPTGGKSTDTGKRSETINLDIKKPSLVEITSDGLRAALDRLQQAMTGRDQQSESKMLMKGAVA